MKPDRSSIFFFGHFHFLGHCVSAGGSLHTAPGWNVFQSLPRGSAPTILRNSPCSISPLRLGSAESYFYTYWTLAIVDVVLQVAVAYELASHVFSTSGGVGSRCAALLRGRFSAASILVASGLTWLATPPTRTLRLAIVIRGKLFFSRPDERNCFVAMIALSVNDGPAVGERTSPRLAQGLGVYSLWWHTHRGRA